MRCYTFELETCCAVCTDGTLPVRRRRRTHAFGGGEPQSCLRPLTEDDRDEGNDEDGDPGTAT